MMKILLYGYGNPGRQDDGLGNEFVNRFEKWIIQEGLEEFSFDSNYQLNIEDAHDVSDKDIVVFVDASEEEIDDFCISKIDATTKASFTTHAASPGYIIKLCHELYKKYPAAFLLHIKGYEWNFTEGLTEAAENNLNAAIDYCKILFNNPESLLEKYNDLKKCK